MNSRKYTALVTLAAGAILAPAAQAAGKQAGDFPSYIPFNASLNEYPEGVAVDKVGNVYVSVGQSPFGPLLDRTDQIWKFSPTGEKSLLADFGPPGGGGCGLAVDAEGNVYLARNAPGHNGVFRVDRNGTVTLLPGTEQIVFPNAVVFDDRGNLFVSETFSLDASKPGGFGMGGIWRIPKKGGSAELWLRDELLTGSFPPTIFPYPIGANGIGFFHGELYVANSDQALLARVPVLPNGSPGPIEIWAHLQEVTESPFAGSIFPILPDDFAFDVHGNAYIGVPSRGVVRINAADRSQDTIAVWPANPLLDAPCYVAFGTGKGERTSIFVTNLGYTGVLVPGLPWAGPSLIKLEVGIPGLPLP